MTTAESSCCVCADALTPTSFATCGVCGHEFHLNQRSDIEGKDCGLVWINEEHLGLAFLVLERDEAHLLALRGHEAQAFRRGRSAPRHEAQVGVRGRDRVHVGARVERPIGPAREALGGRPPRGVVWVQLEGVARIEPAPRGVGEVRREPGPNDPPAPAPEPTEAVRRIGAPVVLEPLRSPLRAELDERVPAAPRIAFPKPLQATINAFTGYRAYVDHRVILSTEAGDIRVRLRPG